MKTENEGLWCLLDIRGLILHCYHSGTDKDAVTDAEGNVLKTPGHTLMTFTERYLKPISELVPLNKVIAVHDSGNEYRKTLFPEYKAHRKESSPEVKKSLMASQTAVRQLLHSLGIPQVSVSGTEADDALAYFVENLPGRKLIYTVDGDLIALANDTVSVFLKGEPRKTFVKDGVEIQPNAVTLFKSLCGDSSDGYKGVHGFGISAWQKLVAEYGDDGLMELSAIVDNNQFGELQDIIKAQPGQHPLLEKIAAKISEWSLGWKLAKLHPELVNLKVKKEFRRLRWEKRVPSMERLTKLTNAEGVPFLVGELQHLLPKQYLILKGDMDEAALTEFRALIAESSAVGLDYETWALRHAPFEEAATGEYVDMLSSKITGMGITCGRNLEYTFYFNFGHADTENCIDKEKYFLAILKCIPKEVPLIIQNCLLGDVEVLTPAGWKQLADVSTDDQVMQWDSETSRLSFTYPTAKIHNKSSELINWDGGFHSCSYTPGHRVYYKERRDTSWRVKTADQLKDTHPNSHYLPVAGVYKPSVSLSFTVDEARFVEAVRADGSYLKSTHCIKFKFSKTRKIERLRSLLKCLGLSFSEKTYVWDDKVAYFIVDRCEFVSKVTEFLGDDKEYTIANILKLSDPARNAIVDELQYWDGGKQAHSKSAVIVTTISKNTVDALQVLAHITGKRFSVSWSENKRGYGTANARPLARINIADKFKTKFNARATTVSGDFDVFCISVPSGAFLVRSNGKVHITGNCYFEGSVTKAEFGYDLYEHHTIYDTKLMASHVDEMESSGLKDLSKRWMNYDQIRYSDVIEKGKSMKDYTSEHVFKYGADDSLITSHLFDLFYIILNLEKTWEFVRDVEFFVPPVLIDAYLAGVTIDYKEVERQKREDQETYDRALDIIREVLREQLTDEAIELGVKNWLPELEAEFDAVTKEVLDEANGDEALAEARARERVVLEEKLRESLKYSEFSEEEKPATFQLKAATLSKMAKELGLPPTPDNLERAEFEAWFKAMPTPKGAALGFCHDVLSILFLAKNRNNSKQYALLKEQYQTMFKGKAVKSGTELNLDSPKQNQLLFYGMLALPIRNRNLDVSEARQRLGLPGAAQANEDAIHMAIAMGDATGWKRDVLENFLKAKKAMTRIKLFYNKLPLWKHPVDGNIHPTFNQCGTETRRPTGSSPNLSQISKKGEGVKVRNCVLPNENLGHDVISPTDVAAEELRVAGAVSQDKAFIACYVGDNLLDVHSLTASGMAGVSYDEFIAIRKDHTHPKHKSFDDIRKSAKNVNFLSAYGGGKNKLARKLLCHPDVAGEYLEAKKKIYAGYEQWREDTIKELHTNGYVRSIYGSMRHLFNKLNHSDPGMVSYYERAAINYIIQGSCADMLKVMIAKLYKRQVLKRYNAVLYIPLYDELVISGHSHNAVELVKEVYEIMTEHVTALDPIPILANPAIGVNFGQQIEILEDENDTLTDAKISAAIDKAFGVENKEAA